MSSRFQTDGNSILDIERNCVSFFQLPRGCILESVLSWKNIRQIFANNSDAVVSKFRKYRRILIIKIVSRHKNTTLKNNRHKHHHRRFNLVILHPGDELFVLIKRKLERESSAFQIREKPELAIPLIHTILKESLFSALHTQDDLESASQHEILDGVTHPLDQDNVDSASHPIHQRNLDAVSHAINLGNLDDEPHVINLGNLDDVPHAINQENGDGVSHAVSQGIVDRVSHSINQEIFIYGASHAISQGNLDGEPYEIKQENLDIESHADSRPGNLDDASSNTITRKSSRLANKDNLSSGLTRKLLQCKVVPARPDHCATVAEDNIIFAYPVDKPNYSNPLYPSRGNNTIKESKPVQATDNETDTLDSSILATNFSTHRSIFGTNLQSGNQSPRGLHSSDISTSSPSLNIATSGQYLTERREINSTDVSYEVLRDATTYIPKPPRYPNYVSLASRKLTFQSPIWNVSSKPEIGTLTEYGLFFTGSGDLVRCFQCGIGFKDWAKDDDVLAEHIRYSSGCEFLRQKFGSTEIERLKNSLSGTGNESNGYRGASNSPPLPYKIRSPRYQTMDARMASFSSFPPQIVIQHRTLAVAGLYYTGNGDLCRCFACDGGLKDWSTGDDPIEEHATYFPNCPYINQLKGQEYVKEMQSRRTNSSFTGTAGTGTRSQEGFQGGASSQASNHAGTAQGAMSQVSQSFAALSMDEPCSQNNSSSVLSAQVFQQLGYTELDVTTARAELHRKGNKNPTSEDIVNTILDTQERTRHQTEGAARNELQEMLEENERLSDIVHCKLCVTGEPDILFLPCAHHKVCRRCAEDLTHCPICRKQIKEKVKTFRA